MRALRWLGASLILVFALRSVHSLVVQPYRCNIVTIHAQKTGEALFLARQSRRTAIAARDGLYPLQRCIESCPTDVELYVNLALYELLLRRFDHAAQTYREALKYDQRPEVYFNLGLVELQRNRRTDAIASFIKACSFDFKWSLKIPDESVTSEVVTAVLKERMLAQSVAGR
jgi:tetratricopeptide (TPR) repeat protein